MGRDLRGAWPHRLAVGLPDVLGHESRRATASRMLSLAGASSDTSPMADTETASPRPFHWMGPLLRSVACSRAMLVGSAGFTLVVGGLIGTYWILILRNYWEGQFTCSAEIGHTDAVRLLVSGAGVGLALVVIATLFAVARGPARIRTVHLVSYWSATIGLWVVLPILATTGVAVDACLRSLFL